MMLCTKTDKNILDPIVKKFKFDLIKLVFLSIKHENLQAHREKLLETYQIDLKKSMDIKKWPYVVN